MEKIILIY